MAWTLDRLLVLVGIPATCAQVAAAGPLAVTHPAVPAGAPAGAALVTWAFAGDITCFWDPNEFFGDQLAPGPFVGSVTFDASTPDSSDRRNQGLFEDAIVAISFRLGDVEFVGPASGLGLFLDNVINVKKESSDLLAFHVAVESTGASANLELILLDRDRSTFSELLLPLSPPPLSAFEEREILIQSELDPFVGFLDGEVTSLVPEPTGLLLLALGVVAGSGSIRRRRPFTCPLSTPRAGTSPPSGTE